MGDLVDAIPHDAAQEVRTVREAAGNAQRRGPDPPAMREMRREILKPG